MGNHLLGNPTGRGFVPGTSTTASSAYAPPTVPNLFNATTVPTAAPNGPGQVSTANPTATGPGQLQAMNRAGMFPGFYNASGARIRNL